MSEFSIVMSNLLAIAVIVTYFRQVAHGDSIPNPSTWLLLTTISLMNAVSYFAVVQGNIWQSWYVFVMATGLSSIFLYSLFKGKFAKFGTIEIICVALAVCVGIIWKTTGNVYVAHLSLQIILWISITPTLYGLWRGTLREKAFAWNLTILSHVFAAIGILTSGSFIWIALVYPLITGIIGNGSVVLILLLQNKGILKKKMNKKV